MPLKLPLPIIYPITSGTATPQTIPDILRLVQAAVDAEVPIFQIREKTLPERVLYDLTSRAVEITRGSETRLLVNGRVDIARAAGADGAHLPIRTFLEDCVPPRSAAAWRRFQRARSAPQRPALRMTKAAPGRRTPGRRVMDLVIGVSTHSLDEARAASQLGADFVVFGPVFETESKRGLGEPQGLDKLRHVTRALDDFPVVAIGGITLENVGGCFEAGASGIAAIRLLSDSAQMPQIVKTIRDRFTK